MPTVQEIAANLAKKQASSLSQAVKASPEEKCGWKPLDNGRCMIDQVVECGGLNFFASQLLQTREVPPIDPSMLDTLKQQNDTSEKALALLEGGTDALVAAIQAFPTEHLDDTITLPFGGGMTKSFAEIMFMAYWNMAYHEGQINYIQTLYGDKDMH